MASEAEAAVTRPQAKDTRLPSSTEAGHAGHRPKTPRASEGAAYWLQKPRKHTVGRIGKWWSASRVEASRRQTAGQSLYNREEPTSSMIEGSSVSGSDGKAASRLPRLHLRSMSF